MVLSIFGNVIGRLFGSDLPYNDDTVQVCFRPGILLDVGISWIKFLRTVLISGCAVGAAGQAPSHKCDQVCRATELPIYINEDEHRQKREPLCPPEPGVIEQMFGGIRKSVWSVVESVSGVKESAQLRIDEGSESAAKLYKYLSEESDDSVRMGAIGVGALSGLILGLRGGLIRKVFFSGLGAYGMAAVCYPNQTKEYTKDSIQHGRKYATIGYNFVFGVKKDDIPLPQLPKLPSSMGEMWEMAGELGKSASSLITGGGPAKDNQAQQQSAKVRPYASDQVKEAHDSASKSCHCPVGACLGHPDGK